ncbi:MAG: Flp pilus assembly protein CpaB [Robiginitomaculum sp.]
MRINTLVTLGASATFGFLAIMLARGWIDDAVHSEFKSQPSAVSEHAPSVMTTQVLVADLDLGFGDVLDQQALRLVDMPTDLLPLGVFTDFESLFGSDGARTVVLSKMGYNEPILDYKISGPGGRGSLSALIGEGMRAASIRVNAVAGVGGFILPGDHVDVILTRDLATGDQDRKLSSDVLLQNVRVLGADQNADKTSSRVEVAKTVTLEVTPRQAQKLSISMDVGTLSLTLRRVGALEATPTSRIDEQQLFSNTAPKHRARTAAKAAPKPRAPAPDMTAQVTIMRSGQREAVSVRKEVIERAQGTHKQETQKTDAEKTGDELAGKTGWVTRSKG